MKKYKLSLDDLTVDAFSTTPDKLGQKGTVMALTGEWAETCWGLCGQPSGAIGGCDTMNGTCEHDYSCQAETCPGAFTCDGYPQAEWYSCGWECETSLENTCGQ